MSTITTSCCLDTSASVVAYDEAHSRMAVYDQTGRLSVWARADGPKPWTMESTWTVLGARVAALAWAPAEFGAVLCCGTADGRLTVWEERRRGAGWAAVADLKKSGASVLDLRFAPRQLGPLVAAAYADGAVRLFEASAVLAAERWELSNELEASPAGQACTSLAWRQATPGVPPLLLVGTRDGGAAVWAYQTATMRWDRAAQVGSATDDYVGQPVSSVAWAPVLGQPAELVAVAAGPQVFIWSLRGPTDSMQVERLAVLEHKAPVWKVEWALFGNWLAASTETAQVALWRPDLAGEWLLCNSIEGEKA